MSANVETMFSVREVPWHGIGTIVQEAPTSEEAIVMAGLDWEVQNRPIYTGQGVEIAGYVANTRSSDDKVLGIVSNRYTIVQNTEAFAFTDSLIGEGLKYETAGSLKGGRQVWLLAKMPQKKILGDKVDPYICFTNTHDGSGAVRVCMTPIRVVCNNTLNLALKDAKRMWSTRHVGDIQGKLEEAKQTLGLAEQYMDALVIEAERLVDKAISDARIEKILDNMLTKEEMSELQKARADEMKEQFFICYDAEDIKQFKGTKYGAVMAMTDLIDHRVPNRQTKQYQENLWKKIMNGHKAVDTFYTLVG